MTDLEKRLKSIADGLKKMDLVAMAVEAVHNNDAEIIDTVTDDQLFAKGIDGTGSAITPTYSPFTVGIKRQKGQPSDRVTLKDTGAFHNSVFMEKTDFPIFLNARDMITPDLFKKYGDEILDLTEQNKSELVEDRIKPEIQEKFRKYYESL